MSKFVVHLYRTYTASDEIEVEAKDENEAMKKAVEVSNDTDYSSSLQYDDCEIDSVQEIKDGE